MTRQRRGALARVTSDHHPIRVDADGGRRNFTSGAVPEDVVLAARLNQRLRTVALVIGVSFITLAMQMAGSVRCPYIAAMLLTESDEAVGQQGTTLRSSAVPLPSIHRVTERRNIVAQAIVQ